MEEYRKQFVLNLLAYATQRDISPAELCRLSGLDLMSLKKGNGRAITAKQFNDLWRNAIHLTNDQTFALHFAESLQLSALGVVGQIIQSSNTVGDALMQAAQAIHLIADLLTMEVSRKNKHITIKFVADKHKKAADTFALRQWMEFFMVFTIHELDGLILNKIKPQKVKLFLNDLADLNEYERLLRCKLQHSADECSMNFDGSLWNEPIITANYELQRLMLDMVKTNPPPTNEIALSEKIINHLTANAYLGVATLEEVASNFNTSPRTLQRKLREEGISFQQLADSVRKSIALHYLQFGNHPIKEISYILGYNELSAFTRAFKRWTGKAPIDYQKTNS